MYLEPRPDERPFRDKNPPRRAPADAKPVSWRVRRLYVTKRNRRRCFAGWLRNGARTAAQILKFRKFGEPKAAQLATLSLAWQTLPVSLDLADEIVGGIVMRGYTPRVRPGILFFRRPAMSSNERTNLYVMACYGPRPPAVGELYTVRGCQRLAREVGAVAVFCW